MRGMLSAIRSDFPWGCRQRWFKLLTLGDHNKFTEHCKGVCAWLPLETQPWIASRKELENLDPFGKQGAGSGGGVHGAVASAAPLKPKARWQPKAAAKAKATGELTVAAEEVLTLIPDKPDVQEYFRQKAAGLRSVPVWDETNAKEYAASPEGQEPVYRGDRAKTKRALTRADLIKRIGDLATKDLVGTVSDGPRELHLALCVGTDFAREDGSGGLLMCLMKTETNSQAAGIFTKALAPQKWDNAVRRYTCTEGCHGRLYVAFK
ncbi:hypothetical protein AK812_SmicGene28065 [Symbiodinium microadriaticum]|uniref:Uncharacterized protein n=1 Tax=Symbiodinium microadriaticum TaxID=2951 RepID=A0A1Q9D5A0_SYMMI|nr:hypothetical protein AK812_SmicGene28065 [Symbiodinium microadriaticum]